MRSRVTCVSSPIRLPATSLNCRRRMSSELKLNRHRAIGDHNRLECFVCFFLPWWRHCIEWRHNRRLWSVNDGQTPSDIRGESSQVWPCKLPLKIKPMDLMTPPWRFSNTIAERFFSSIIWFGLHSLLCDTLPGNFLTTVLFDTRKRIHSVSNNTHRKSHFCLL
jgi:hypothetical protein